MCNHKHNVLIARVAEIDRDAALYLRHEASALRQFCSTGDLWTSFVWGWTPHGEKYWRRIAEELMKEVR